MSHTMKLWEKVIEHGLRHAWIVSDNQFGFILGWLTMGVIFLLRPRMEKYREVCEDLHMVFIDLY